MMWLKPKMILLLFIQSAKADCNRCLEVLSIAVDFSQLS